MKTVHIILNSHIDPIWLWPWQSGLDSILNTCRTVCDILHRNPDTFFTCGEAWKYFQIQRTVPDLFERIRRFVDAGRWEIVGWWIQPDCNQPSRWAMEKQIQLGKQYFQREFGVESKIGYNVDSFGHAAVLPELMRAAGQESYVMMRPQEHECALPARIFRWRGYEGGPEVTTFRVARGYCDWPSMTDRLERVRGTLTELPEGVDHTMFYLGMGDHGGGISQQQIDWCRENASAIPGARIVFSTVSRFFAAIAPHVARLPLVTGELQMHAIGCYSVYRPIKLAVRATEHLLRQASVGVPDANLEDAWRALCFNHFHDTLGGTCVPSGYVAAEAQLGGAIAAADDVLHVSLRRWMAASLPNDSLQRLVFWNASDTPYTGYLECEPWTEGRTWKPHYKLLDDHGLPVPMQTMQPEGAVDVTRILFRADIAPNTKAIFRIDTHINVPQTNDAGDITRTADGVAARNSTGVDLLKSILCLGGNELPLPRLHLLQDATDTWSHGIDRYSEGPAELAEWSGPFVLDEGPLMGSVFRRGRIGHSLVQEEWRVYGAEQFIELRLRVNFQEQQKVLKLIWPSAGRFSARVDGVMGRWADRAIDGVERPLRDFTLLTGSGIKESAMTVGVVCPHVFALDVTPYRARFTLLRSPMMAHHEPALSERFPRPPIADQGVHHFVLRFFGSTTPEELDLHAMMLQRPPLLGEWTAGMPG